MGRLLITGGGGYLGSLLTGLLLQQGYSVRILDRFCFDSEAALRDLSRQFPEQLDIQHGDIRRLQESSKIFGHVDTVIHLAALANDPTCDLDEDMAYDVNVESTRELARKSIEHGVKRFVLASSCSVYGQGLFDYLDEDSPTNPVSSFGRTKLAAETALMGMDAPDFEPVIARMATLFGWSPRMRFDLAVNLMTATAVRQQRISVKGGGNQWRPFLHVQDAARAIAGLAMAEDGLVSRQIFNVGADALNMQIAALAEHVAGQFKDVRVEMQKDDEDRRNFRVCFQKLHKRLDFSSTLNIEDGVREVRGQLSALTMDPFDEQHVNCARMKTLRATPVQDGGEPVAARFVALSRPWLGQEEEDAVLEALRSGWLTSGPQVPVFERMFCAAVQAAHGVAVCSCTAAIHLCLEHLGVKPGDEVITTPITWASTGNTLVHMGVTPRFVDVEPDTLNLDPDLLEAAMNERTRAVIPVHLAGHPCRLDEIYAIARKHNLPVIEDAAHALGAAYKGIPIGSYGDYTCFSFYAIKNITTMEGGLATTRNAEDAAAMRMLASNGMAATAWDRYGRSAAPGPAQVVKPGFKYAMGNVHAAMGVQQLQRMESFMTGRARLAELYLHALSAVEEILLPPVHEYARHAWHLFMVRLRLDRLTCSRDELALDLRHENIGTGIHFYGMHLHPYFREALGVLPESLPVATQASEAILSLPLHPQLTPKNVQEVVCALKKVLAYRLK